MNRNGECPHCGENWDGGEIIQVLGKMDTLAYNSAKDLQDIAAKFGWTPENKRRFSLVDVIETEVDHQKYTLLQCPKCNHVFDDESEIEFKNLQNAKQSIGEQGLEQHEPVGDS